MKKRLLSLLLMVCMMMTFIPVASASTTKGNISMTIGSTTMFVNGSAQSIDAEGSRATLTNGNTMLPIRAVIEAIGGTIAWNATTRQITMKYNNETVVVTLGSKTAVVNGQNKSMTAAPFTDNGRTYVWLRTVEFFSGVTVSWDATTRTASVAYPYNGPTGNAISLTVKNATSTYLWISEVTLAPTGTNNYSSNLLTGGAQILPGSSGTYNVTLVPGVYDMRVKDAYSNYYTYTKLDLTKCNNYAQVTLNSGSTYSLSVDGAPAFADRSNSLIISNKTGKAIKSVSYAVSNNWVFNDFQASAIGVDQTGTFAMSFSSAEPYYDIRVNYVDGTTQTFSRVNMTYYTTNTFISITTSGFVYGNVAQDVEITFKNDSGVSIRELYMVTSNTSSAWKNADSMISSRLSDGKSTTFELDMDGNRTWYFRAYYRDEDGDDVYHTGRLTFVNNVASVTVTLDEDGDFSKSKEKTSSSSSSGSSSSSDDEVTLTVINGNSSSSGNIAAMFFVPYADLSDFDSDWTYADFEDEYKEYDLEHSDMETFDVEVNSSGRAGVVVFYGSSVKSSSNSYHTFSFRANESALAVVSGTGSSSMTFYQDRDLDSGEEFYTVYWNQTGDDIEAEKLVIVRDGRSNWDGVNSSRLSSGRVLVVKNEYDDFSYEYDFGIMDSDDDVTTLVEDVDFSECDFMTLITLGTKKSNSDVDYF